MSTRFILLLLMVIAVGCKDGPDAPKACTSTTGSVEARVTSTSGGLTFDWEPACPVALVLIEEDASDMWVAAAPDLDDTSGEEANIILPPVTYGQLPPGTETSEPAEPLIAGRTYELVIWRVVPPSTNVTCQARFGNACMVALKPFVR